MSVSLRELVLYILVLIIPLPLLPIDVHRDLVYKQVGDRPIDLDLFVPQNSTQPVPVIVIVHGGVWFAGNNRDYGDFSRHFSLGGLAVATINYRRLPPDRFADQVADIKDAIRWLRSNASRYNLDPNRIGLFGSSAGGHLAGLAGFAGDGEGLGDDPPGTSSRANAVFLLYGVYDLTKFGPEWILRAFLHTDSEEELEDAERRFSHAPYIDGSEPRTRIMHGTRDRMVPYEQAEAEVALLQSKGVDADLVSIRNEKHGWCKLLPWKRAPTCKAIVEYFQEVFAAQ